MYELEEMILRIKKVKKSKNFSNEDLSKLSGVSLGTLAKILGSETRDPRISNIIGIAKALNVSADYLIFGKDETIQSEIPIEQIWQNLNADGKQKLLEYADDLAGNDKYKKCPDSENQDIG